MLDRDDCLALDHGADSSGNPVAGFAARFAAGAPGTLYFDANSIGPMPLAAPERVRQVLDQGWRIARRRSWNETDWLDQPRKLGGSLSRVLGAGAGDVLVADSTTINQHKLLHHALDLNAPRDVVVVEREVFPSNRYAAEAASALRGARLRDISCSGELGEALAAGDVAVVALSLVDYRSSTRLDLVGITELIHAHGALALWDLSHAAGAVAVSLEKAGVDCAVGCVYKYLCGGPGAPAWLYVHPRHSQSVVWPALAGWMGHSDAFAFEPGYRPAASVSRHQAGTPAVIANAAMSAAADIWCDVDPQELDERHRSLTNLLIRLVDEQCAEFGVTVASPREHAKRGGHVTLRFSDAQAEGDVSALAQALVEAGVIVSSRKPDALRLASHPLVARHTDLWDAVSKLRGLLLSEQWRDPRYRRASV